MFRIRRVYDDTLPIDREELAQVKEILRARFPSADKEEIESLGERLRNPFLQRFRTILFVADTLAGRVNGFAVILHEPIVGFAFLDWIAVVQGRSGSGLGGALYERVRQECKALGVKGLFLECLPDDGDLCPDEAMLEENRARLRFYENYGARPIINTKYESPITPCGDRCMPYLLYDGLGSDKEPDRSFVRRVVRAILERKYGDLCSREYVEMVVASFEDNPVRLRPFVYVKPADVRLSVESRAVESIGLVVTDRHDIHHVHDRGYVESPVRVRSILSALQKSALFTETGPRAYSVRHIRAVHAPGLVNYIERACAETPEGKSIYPYVFPIRNRARAPRERSVLAGYYCIDTFTPINRNVYPAARRAVDCALTAADRVLKGMRVCYALVRPPGHHAESRVFGGFCYFNNTAIAAHYLSRFGRVAVLDLDYHHGNGTQEIFYGRNDVLSVSIHGHPSFAYPYFSGFADEVGEGIGEGFNLNLPLPESVDGPRYRRALEKALERIEAFDPAFLVVALGLDPAKGDPTGTWSLLAKDFEENGRMVGMLGLPTVVVQEGGYRTRTLGINALRFFMGLSAAYGSRAGIRSHRGNMVDSLSYRTVVEPQDIRRVAELTAATGFFSQEEVEIAASLVRERLEKGAPSGYMFLMAEENGRLVGFTCYGPIPGTRDRYDLYWIVVRPDYQGRGIGKALLKATEEAVRREGGKRIYVDTSQRPQYAGTRAFYERCGYLQSVVLDDFYAPGDGKAIFLKVLEKDADSR